MRQTYYIDTAKGIYYLNSVYDNEANRVYVVRLDAPNAAELFASFLNDVRKDGAREQMQRLRKQFDALRQLLGS